MKKSMGITKRSRKIKLYLKKRGVASFLSTSESRCGVKSGSFGLFKIKVVEYNFDSDKIRGKKVDAETGRNLKEQGQRGWHFLHSLMFSAGGCELTEVRWINRREVCSYDCTTKKLTCWIITVRG